MGKTLDKLCLDIILTALFILLLYPRQTGFSFHETAGLASGALVLLHLLLNWSWVKNVSRNMFNAKVKGKTKYFYLLDAVSLIALGAIIITGVQVSTVLFPAAGPASRFIITWHKWLSYCCLGLLGLHLALHRNFFIQTVPRLFKSPRRPAGGKVVLNLGALLLTLALLFTQSGFNPAGHTVSSQPSLVAARGGIPPAEYPSGPVADTMPASSPTSNSRGNGRKNHDTATAAPTTAPTAISPGSTSSKSGTSIGTAPDTNSDPGPAPVSLTQYLGNLFCTGCSKRCSLLAPQCSIGFSQADAAQQQFTAIYGPARLNPD